MSELASVIVRFFLPLVAGWGAATATVAVVMVRLTSAARRGGPPRLAPEVWGAVAATGSAAGGVLGFSTVVPSLPAGAQRAADVALGRVLGVTSAGMLLGAAATAAFVLVAVWLWTGGE